MPYKVDVCSPEMVHESAEAVRAKFGEVTLLINNAGIVKPVTVEKAKIDDVRKILDVNVVSHWVTV